MGPSRRWLLVVLGCLGAAGAAAEELAELSLEELMDIEVYTVGRRDHTLFESASAVTILTADDIRRAGVTTLPDALRLVPGVQVARIDVGKWSITARGFGGQFANKLLVLVDGRSVYTPLFGGVYWDVQDLLLEDVDRIEIVRGPGASLWGANAVNGVINVITRPAAEAQGTLATVGTGDASPTVAATAHGGRLDAGTTWRASMRWFDAPAGRDTARTRSMDDRRLWRASARLDGGVGDTDWSVLASIYGGESRQTLYRAPLSLEPPYRRTVPTSTDLSGGHVLGRWVRQRTDGETQVQSYIDRMRRDDPYEIRESRDTWDLDMQHRQEIGRHRLLAGLGYRVTRDDVGNTFFWNVRQRHRTDQLYSAFLQNEVALASNMHVTLGLKGEHNSYTGVEMQPNVRLLWTPVAGHSLWGALSRAVRTPVRGESGQSITVDVLPPGTFVASDEPTRVAIENDSPVLPDRVLAWEAGWRARLRPGLLVDVAGFVNDYEDIMSLEFATPYAVPEGDPPHLVLPLELNNAMSARVTGVEVATDWQPLTAWRLRTSYSFLDMEIDDPNVRRAREAARSDARHKATHWSSIDLPADVELDVVVRHLGELPHHGVDAYTTLDLRVGWSPRPGWQLSAGGRNLTGGARREYGSGFHNLLPTLEERSLSLRITMRFDG